MKQSTAWLVAGAGAAALYLILKPFNDAEEAVAKVVDTAIAGTSRVYTDVTGGTVTTYQDSTGAISTVYRDAKGLVIYVWQEDIEGVVKELWSKFWSW